MWNRPAALRCVFVQLMQFHFSFFTDKLCVLPFALPVFLHVHQIGNCVTMNGHPQPRIIWFKNDQPIPEVKDTKASMCPLAHEVKYYKLLG